MNAQQLKNSILQEAIEGRLVPQDPNDEPASVLLDKIRKEKAKLVKEGKLKKKDLEEICISEEEIPFEIPENWIWVRLGQICIVQDIDHKMPEKKNEGIPYISPLDFYGDNGIDYTNAKKISKEDFLKLSKKCLPRKGDIIFPRYGTIGAVRLIEAEIDFLVSYSCATIKTILNNTDSKYIFHALQSPFIQKVEIDKYINKTTQPNVGLQSILKFLFPLPPLAEQKRIVEKIEELLPKVEEYGKAQDSLDKLNEELPERLKKSILQEAIEGRLVPQDPNDEPASVLLDKIRAEKKRLVKEGKLKKKDLEETPISENEIPFELPESWIWCRLNDICIFLSRGKSPSYSDIPNDYPVFAQKCNLKDGGISLEQARFLNPETVSKWPEEYHLRTNDVLVNSTGTGTVCRTRLFNKSCLGNYPFTVPDSHVSVVRTSEYICSAYIFNLFNSKIYQDYWEDRLAGSTNQKELYIGVLQNTIIPLPPLAEQKRIVEKIEKVMKEIDKLNV